MTESPDPASVRSRVEGDPRGLLPDSATLEMDQIFRLLSDYRRRHVLTYLLREKAWVQLGSVADYIVIRELGIDPAAVPDERKRLHTALYHTHVPMLAGPGLVAYDRERDRVRATPEIERATPFLEIAADRNGLSSSPGDRYRDVLDP